MDGGRRRHRRERTLNEGYARNPAGLRLYYRILGEDGPALVTPGACFLQEDLAPLAHGRRVVFFDRSGRGRSDAIPADMPVTFGSEFEDIDAIRAHLGLERFALMGWSYMGLVAGLYAADHPDVVERVLLSGAIAPRNLAVTELSPELERQRDEALRRRRERVDADAVQRLEDAHDAGQWADEVSYCREHRRLTGPRQFGRPEAMLRTKADPCDLPNEWPANSAQLMRRIFSSVGETWDFRGRVTNVRAPTLVVHGAEDLVLPNAARLWGTLIDDARVLWLDGIGHFPWLEDPDAFFPAVDGFLRGEWPAAAERVTHAY
ncbi:MAG TPA: alpha/beta hydrolase [Candidatus Limnocylindria bacterium]|nr:alpha/beta hydrolase [Candidatus Limnocylindria bacterium]